MNNITNELKSLQTPLQLVRTEEDSWMRSELLRGTETSPVAYDTSLRITMTWTTEKPSSTDNATNGRREHFGYIS